MQTIPTFMEDSVKVVFIYTSKKGGNMGVIGLTSRTKKHLDKLARCQIDTERRNAMFKITESQSKEINWLVRKQCCNHWHGNCLLLDDVCIQLLARYRIYCKYFAGAVLPGKMELYAEIAAQQSATEIGST